MKSNDEYSKSVEFVKKFGLNTIEDYADHCVNVNYLKRLVESHELVESYGGLEKAKLRCYPAKHLTMESYHQLKQAILDVESCQ